MVFLSSHCHPDAETCQDEEFSKYLLQNDAPECRCVFPWTTASTLYTLLELYTVMQKIVAAETEEKGDGNNYLMAGAIK